jgi:diguanylate cyclase (GGDEF)-like protein
VLIPLHVEGRPVGVVYAHARSRFGENREVLEAFATEVSSALRNALLFAATTTDPITGAFRRAFVLERLQQELKAAQRRGEACSVLRMQIQGLDALNQTHGQPAGDRVLQTLGAMLRLWMRDTDVIGRVAADQFLLILPSTPTAGAETVVKRLLQQADRLVVEHESYSLPMRFRVGGATLLPPEADESLNLNAASVESAAQILNTLADRALEQNEPGAEAARVRQLRWSQVLSPEPEKRM